MGKTAQGTEVAMSNGDDHDRLTRLEVKLDHVVEKVDQIVAGQEAQWKRIDQHSRQIAYWRGMLYVIGGLCTLAWAEVKGLFGGDR